jgi:hypothetical protein
VSGATSADGVVGNHGTERSFQSPSARAFRVFDRDQIADATRVKRGVFFDRMSR